MYIKGFEAGYKEAQQSQQVIPKEECGLHSTDWYGKCFKCGEQVFLREGKRE